MPIQLTFLKDCIYHVHIVALPLTYKTLKNSSQLLQWLALQRIQKPLPPGESPLPLGEGHHQHPGTTL